MSKIIQNATYTYIHEIHKMIHLMFKHVIFYNELLVLPTPHDAIVTQEVKETPNGSMVIERT